MFEETPTLKNLDTSKKKILRKSTTANDAIANKFSAPFIGFRFARVSIICEAKRAEVLFKLLRLAKDCVSSAIEATLLS